MKILLKGLKVEEYKPRNVLEKVNSHSTWTNGETLIILYHVYYSTVAPVPYFLQLKVGRTWESLRRRNGWDNFDSPPLDGLHLRGHHSLTRVGGCFWVVLRLRESGCWVLLGFRGLMVYSLTSSPRKGTVLNSTDVGTDRV